jgi:hypothetical protein
MDPLGVKKRTRLRPDILSAMPSAQAKARQVAKKKKAAMAPTPAPAPKPATGLRSPLPNVPKLTKVPVTKPRPVPAKPTNPYENMDPAELQRRIKELEAQSKPATAEEQFRNRKRNY